jgi:hypothetical protein
MGDFYHGPNIYRGLRAGRPSDCRWYLNQGRPVSALARSEATAKELDSLGITPVPGDLDDGEYQL